MRHWTIAAVVFCLAVGIALFIPRRLTCAPGETLTTTGWNEAVPLCYTKKPIAQLQRGTLPQEQRRVAVQAIIVGAGVIIAVLIMGIERVSSRSSSSSPHTEAFPDRRRFRA
jgi:hypothetical protein